MKNILYYPYINLPQNNWTIRTLLYHDSISCIVPATYFYEPERYNPFMRQLVQEQLVVPVNPMDSLDQPFNSMSKFLEYTTKSKKKRNRRRDRFQTNLDKHLKEAEAKIHSAKFKRIGSHIHGDKFESEILYNLETIGLAKESNDGWFIVEKKTSIELMLFLATVLSNKLNLTPTTDQIESRYKFINRSKKDFNIEIRSKQKRQTILKHLIPRPENIEIRQLLKFKEKHNDLLNQFRNRIEKLVFDKDLNEDSQLFMDIMNELIQRKDELSNKMQEGKLGRILFGHFLKTTMEN